MTVPTALAPEAAAATLTVTPAAVPTVPPAAGTLAAAAPATGPWLAAIDVVRRELDHLDQRRWDDWLELYAPDCVYWVPTWRDEEQLTEDPRRELSHIFYASRAGLEDRIFRIRSGQSPASVPLRRTVHVLGNAVAAGPVSAEGVELRTAWTTHVFDQHRNASELLYGHAEYRMEPRGGQWRIVRRKTIIQNDYLPSMIDIYCL